MNYGKTCDRKQFYRDYGKALEAAKAMTIKTGFLIQPYKCIACIGWHVGKARTDEQEEFQSKKPNCRFCGKELSIERRVEGSTHCNRECRKARQSKKREKLLKIGDYALDNTR